MLRLEDASKSFGGRALFEGASLHVRPDDRVGLVGRNGAGKTTLLRMLAGIDAPDTGTRVLRRGARVGYLRQEVSAVSDRTVLAEAETALEPLRKALEGKRGRSRVTLVVPMPDDSEAEVTLPGSYSIAAGLRDTIGGLPGIAQVEEI